AKEFLLWALLATLWGSSFLAISIGVHDYDPIALVAGRMVIGAAVLTAVLLLSGGNLRLGVRGWAIASIVGLSGNVAPFLLISFAEQTVNSSLAALIMGIAPIVTLALAPLIHHDETLSRPKVLGALAGFCGVIVLVGSDAAQGVTADLIPQLALVMAALCYAFTALFSRRFPFSNPMQMAAASVLIGAMGMLAVSGAELFVGVIPDLTSPGALAIIYLGVGPTALAALIYFYLIPRIGATRLQQVNYVVPVIGTVLGITVLSEQPEWTTWAALPLILLGVYLVSKKEPQPAKLVASASV
ncbi:MAG: DMT family transporter, partial [Hyphomicrobiales bacterium]